MSEEKHQYMYSTEELDNIIEQIERGITPMLTEDMQLEVKMRYQELQSELFDDSDDPSINSVEDVKRHNDLMKKHLEKKKREATKHDIVVIKLNEKQSAELETAMAGSLVREDPDDPYNYMDEQLTDSKERAIIMRKLAGLRNCYYNQIDYVNAIGIIQEAIRYSLKNDYPWMTEQQALDAYNRGEINFTYCNIPKLYINATQQITDRKILRGVVTGEVQLVNRSDDKLGTKTKSKTEVKPIVVPYNVISKKAYDDMAALHARGYDTPLSVAFKNKASVYNRFALPEGNRFNVVSSNTSMSAAEKNRLTQMENFDWSQEGAGEAYFRLKTNRPYSISDLIEDLQDNNDHHIVNNLATNIHEFMRSLNTVENEKHYSVASDTVSNSMKPNPEAVRIEQGILNAIRLSNPNQ